MNPFVILKDDWEKIPQNYRYIIIAGILLIINAWFLDHWGTMQYKLAFKCDFGFISYFIGLILVTFAFGLIIWKQITIPNKVDQLKIKWPISGIDKDFYIVSYLGKWILYDKKTKLYHHLYPWETVQDLGFVSCEHYEEINFDPSKKHEFTIGGYVLNTKDYSNGGSVTTRS
jgi:hypothetical protein